MVKALGVLEVSSQVALLLVPVFLLLMSFKTVIFRNFSVVEPPVQTTPPRLPRCWCQSCCLSPTSASPDPSSPCSPSRWRGSSPSEGQTEYRIQGTENMTHNLIIRG